MSFDEGLLEQLGEDEEVRREGRSAVLRKAATEYLERRRRNRITRQYQKAYGEEPWLGEAFEGWEEQAEWPPE